MWKLFTIIFQQANTWYVSETVCTYVWLHCNYGTKWEGRTPVRALEKYCNQWKLDVNCNKTKIVVFGRGRYTVDYSFMYMSNTVETIWEYLYLCVLFSSNGKISKEQQEVTQSATRAMHCIIAKCRKSDLVDM